MHKELQARLGAGYQYKVEGKGETEPIAKEGGADDEKARQKNRRVEVSYQFKQQTPDAIGATGQPAPFRSQDGQTVASRTATFSFGQSKRRIDVKPFYRDGPYLVAVFDITNLGPGNVSWLFDYRGDDGGAFGSFGVVDPATKLVYRGVRIGPPDQTDYSNYFVDPGRAHFREEPNTTNRGFFYAPAPPPNVTTVTLDAGEFGQIPNIPIR